MILICQWYEPDDDLRLAELSGVRAANTVSGIFSKACYIDGTEKKLTYGQLFTFAEEHFPGELCVIANTDILFDATASLLTLCCRPNRIAALTRWEGGDTPNMMGHLVASKSRVNELKFFSGTQDAWAFVAGTLPALERDVPMGEVGCEQVLLGTLAKQGCEIICPSIDVRARHVHSQHVDYEDAPAVHGTYVYPEMTTILGGTGLVCRHEVPFTLDKTGNIPLEAIHTCPR
jgi:hypothetical protein